MARRRVPTGAAWGQNPPGPESCCPPGNKAVAGHKHRQCTSGVTQPHSCMATGRHSPDGVLGAQHSPQSPFEVTYIWGGN